MGWQTMKESDQQDSQLTSFQNVSDTENRVAPAETKEVKGSGNEKLVGVVLLMIGAAVLYFLGKSTIGLSGGVSVITLGLMLALGKIPKKPEN
jgi:uncharacterized membrane protein YkgB